jgi:putative inorganic carbon (hco3(-)) transporter
VTNRPAYNRELVAIVIAGLAVCGSVPLALAAGASEHTALLVEAAVAGAIAVIYLVWKVDPAWSVSIALLFTAFSGNWDTMLGIPGVLSPDRLLLALAAIVAVARAPADERKRILRVEPIHWVLALSVLYVAGSAAQVGTIDEQASLFRLVQAYGALPFLLFVIAPFAFRTRRQRRILLGCLVAFGAYLGVTALLEVAGLHRGVFPGYIADKRVGIHWGHARGPFVQAAVNGFALYLCATAAVLGAYTWRDLGARLAARAVAVLCLAGCLLTLQRSVWAALLLASLAILFVARELRPVYAPLCAIALLGAVVMALTVPRVSSDLSDVLGDEENVHARQDTNAAALDMIAERPLTGFGWERYAEVSPNFLVQGSDHPLTGGELNQLHNLFLSYAADIGLIGLALWGLGLALGVIGALKTRPTGDLELWRLALVPLVVFFLAVAGFTPSVAAFPILALWLWIGVVWSARFRERRPAAEPRPAASGRA